MSDSSATPRKSSPPPIPVDAEIPASNRKSFRKTLQGLIPVEPQYTDGLIPVDSPRSPSFIEKEVRECHFVPGKDAFVPLDVPGKGQDAFPRVKRRTMILMWVLGIMLILGLSLGLGLGLGLKGLQQPATAQSPPAPSIPLPAPPTPPTAPANAASTTASLNASNPPVSHAGQVVKVPQFAQNAFMPPATATTTTYTVAAATATVGTGFISCPGSDGNTYTTANGKTFTKHCYTDYPGPGVLDLGVVTATSLEQCIDACAKYAGDKGACGAVSYRANLSVMVPAMHGNCALKDKSGAASPGTWDQESAVLA